MIGIGYSNVYLFNFLFFGVDNQNRVDGFKQIKTETGNQNIEVSKKTLNRRIKKSTKNNNAKHKLKTNFEITERVLTRMRTNKNKTQN